MAMVHAPQVLTAPRVAQYGLGAFFSARRTLRVVVIFTLVGAATALVGDAPLPSAGNAFAHDEFQTAVVLSLAPVAIAMVLGPATLSAMVAFERVAARRLTLQRVLHVMLVMGVAWLALLPASLRSQRGDAIGLVTENLFDACGVALLAGRLISPAHSWLVVFPYGFLSLLVAPALPSWATTLTVVNAHTSGTELAIAFLILGCGLVSFTCQRQPEDPG